jgi:predicted ATP-grasp superfamily ATP-dependent carboligase
MNVLVTSSRMPCAIDEIRKLGRRGHRVVASDTFRAAPGNHSRYVAKAIITPSPRNATLPFVEAVAATVREEKIELVLPAFEEVFYLAALRRLLPDSASWFFPPLSTLAALHDKRTFAGLAKDLGLRVPASVVVDSQADLRGALRCIPRYFAKPVYSRGGVELLTNTGPLAGALDVEECVPSPASPWIVQEFVAGRDVCTFSVVHGGRLSAHAAYVHPREIEHAGGIVFESVDEPECLRAAATIAEATRYRGQLSLDFMKTSEGMVLIECNPRPTAGVHLLSAVDFDEALRDDRAEKLRLVQPGVRGKYSAALLRDMLLHWEEAKEDARYLFSDVPELVADPDDLLPAVYQVISYGRVIAYRRHRQSAGTHKNRDLMAAQFEDVSYDGQVIEVPSAVAAS